MEKEEKVLVRDGQEKQPEGQKKKMKTRTKVIAGVAVAALACGVGTGAYFIIRNGGIEELLEDSPLADLVDKVKGDDIDAGSAGNTEKDTDAGAAGAAGAAGTDGAVQKTGYVDNGGAQVGGTSASDSYPIKMSDLCTFSDPAGLSFDTRYVLHGGSDCMPAKRVASTGYSCKEAYVILYARGGQAVGQYECYVMNSESDARGLASALAAAYGSDGGFSYGNWGDVAYMYSPGSYVQDSISLFYKQGAIESETPAAYLGMQFYFGGMSEYQPSAPSGSGSGGNGGGDGSTPGGSTPGGSTPGGSTPGGSTPGGSGGNTPGGTDNPSTPTDPEEPVDPDTPDKPDTSGETSVAVTEEQLTDNLEEALATADSTFPVEITDKYTFEDPEGLEYDTRYVLYGKEGSGAVTAAGQIGSQVNGVYEIYYLKDGKLAAVYRCYDAASVDDAARIESMYGGMGEIKVTGRVACINMKLSMVESMMEMYVQMGYADEATPEAYMAALYENEGYQYFRNPNPAEEPSDELTGTTPEEAFTVKVSDSYTFDETQVLPGTAYDRRYVLYGDETNGFAAQQGAEAFYDVIYEQNSQALYEIKIYVMPGEEEAKTLAGQLVTAGMYAVAMPGTDVVLVIGTDLQETIDTYVQYGQITEATPRAYMEGFLMKLGMTEVTAEGSALSYTSPPQADLNRLLYEAEGLLEMGRAQWTETELEPLIPAAGVLDPAADLSPESVAQAAKEAAAFDPADAGTVPAEAGKQAGFDPAVAGNAGQEADGQSGAGQARDGAAQGEAFDPAAAGSVPAGLDGTAAAEGAVAGTGSETAADGASGETALAAGTTADWEDPDFDDAADRLKAGSASGPQELVIGKDICFADPQDIEFDTRLVFRGDGQSALAAELSAQRQMTLSQVYEIVYVKNGQAAAQYRCLVAGGQVFCQRMKPEKLAERISALPAGQPAFAASLQGYTEWIQQIKQLEEYKEGEETK